MTKDYVTIPVEEAIGLLPAGRQARIKARAKEIVAEELALRDLRKLRQVTQQELARRLGSRQVYISRLERRADVKLSTLKSYIEAIGGELHLVVTFSEGTKVQIKDIGQQRDDTGVPRLRRTRMATT